jgi:hypothetical protein
MATVSGARVAPAARLPGSRFDHAFFLAMSAAPTIAVAMGFAKTYFWYRATRIEKGMVMMP